MRRLRRVKRVRCLECRGRCICCSMSCSSRDRCLASISEDGDMELEVDRCTKRLGMALEVWRLHSGILAVWHLR